MPTATAHAGRAAFRYPDFRRFMAARLLTTMASEMQAVAVAWQVYGLTHRPLDLGLVGLAQFLPGILLFPITGHTADRYSRLHILRACYVAFSVTSLLLLSFTWRGMAVVWPIYLAIAWNGTVRAFNGPAGQAFLPLLVPAEHFPNAVAWNASVFQAATIVGPAAGGLVYGWTGSPLAIYAASACAYLAAFAFMTAVRVRTAERPRAASLGMVLDGFHFIWRHKLILGAISLDLFAVLLGGAVALLPVYAREILHVGASGLGILRSAPGIGAVAMAVIVAHRPLRKRGITLLGCVFGFGVFTIVFGLSRNLALSIVSLALVFIIVNGRGNSSFLPIRDAGYFIDRVDQVIRA